MSVSERAQDFASSFESSRPPAASAKARFGARIEALCDAAPSWMRVEDARVPKDVLAGVPVGPTLVLGMGGSALGARAILTFASSRTSLPHEVRVLDTVDPDVVVPTLQWAESSRANLLVVSKSGTTTEVRAVLEACLQRLPGAALTFVSDPIASEDVNPIAQRLQQSGRAFVHVPMPAEVGGRYSVFTAVGQLPLHAAGLDAFALSAGAIQARDALRQRAAEHPVAAELAWREQSPALGHVLWCYSEALLPWAAWLQQLECESLGRLREDGSRVGELITLLRGPADQHSVAQLLLDGPRDKRVLIADFADDMEHDGGSREASEPTLAWIHALQRLRGIERDATYAALEQPTARLLLRNRRLETLGALMFHGMTTTVLLAETLQISPYGQPAVERIKRNVKERLRSGQPIPGTL